MLLGGRTLYDLANQFRLWEYQGADATAATGGMAWFVVSEGEARPGALVPTKLPQPSVAAAVTKALAETRVVSIVGVGDHTGYRLNPEGFNAHRLADYVKRHGSIKEYDSTYLVLEVRK